MRQIIVLMLGGLVLPAHAIKNRDPLGLKLLRKCHDRILALSQGALRYNLPRFQRMMDAPAWNGEAILDFLGQPPDVLELLNADAGTFQHYSVGVHTDRVFKVAATQDAFLPDDIPAPPGTTWKKLLKLAFALHDISKGVAAEEGDKNHHHHLCVPMAERIMGELELPLSHQTLIRSLISHDLIADVLRGRRSVEDSHSALAELARTNGMEPRDFFRVQLFFFVADAASFNNVRNLHFEQAPDGRLLPTKHPLFRELQSSFGLD